eukprot:403357500
MKEDDDLLNSCVDTQEPDQINYTFKPAPIPEVNSQNKTPQSAIDSKRTQSSSQKLQSAMKKVTNLSKLIKIANKDSSQSPKNDQQSQQLLLRKTNSYFKSKFSSTAIGANITTDKFLDQNYPKNLLHDQNIDITEEQRRIDMRTDSLRESVIRQQKFKEQKEKERQELLMKEKQEQLLLSKDKDNILRRTLIVTEDNLKNVKVERLPVLLSQDTQGQLSQVQPQMKSKTLLKQNYKNTDKNESTFNKSLSESKTLKSDYDENMDPQNQSLLQVMLKQSQNKMEPLDFNEKPYENHLIHKDNLNPQMGVTMIDFESKYSARGSSVQKEKKAQQIVSNIKKGPDYQKATNQENKILVVQWVQKWKIYNFKEQSQIRQISNNQGK